MRCSRVYDVRILQTSTPSICHYQIQFMTTHIYTYIGWLVRAIAEHLFALYCAIALCPRGAARLALNYQLHVRAPGIPQTHSHVADDVAHARLINHPGSGE